ncbi:MAG: hypothetical protein ACYTGX_18960 [Planctomycetota bacterium]
MRIAVTRLPPAPPGTADSDASALLDVLTRDGLYEVLTPEGSQVMVIAERPEAWSRYGAARGLTTEALDHPLGIEIHDFDTTLDCLEATHDGRADWHLPSAARYETIEEFLAAAEESRYRR